PHQVVPIDFYAALEPTISAPRLTRYRMAADDEPKVVIARYLKNIDLTRALYPSLHAFEVAFRNALSAEIVEEYGPDWYVDLDFRDWIEEKGCGTLDEAIERLEDSNKTVHSDRLIAQLTLGFWVNLINRKREQFWIPRLSRILPDAEPSDRD